MIKTIKMHVVATFKYGKIHSSFFLCLLYFIICLTIISSIICTYIFYNETNNYNIIIGGVAIVVALNTYFIFAIFIIYRNIHYAKTCLDDAEKIIIKEIKFDSSFPEHTDTLPIFFKETKITVAFSYYSDDIIKTSCKDFYFTKLIKRNDFNFFYSKKYDELLLIE